MSEKSSKLSSWPLLVVFVVLLAGVLLRPRFQPPHTPQPLPPLQAAGWLNSDGEPDLTGKVVVLDAWFTTCPPCLAALPELALLKKQYADDPRVAFVGLTFEGVDRLPAIQDLIQRIDGFDWPVAYDADIPLDMLNVQGYPTLFVFDKTGVSVWRGHDTHGLRAALAAAL